ncbi:MAG TPA: aldo/keto reductase [Candidatus Paenibacillus intestinavium]|nr:aldo/keto reductase [Candidatus Paenibacillus intestinavium]
MVNNLQDTTTLHNGVKMPMLGLGVFLVEEGAELENAVKTAIQHGYRSIDTAAIYGNEEGVGRGIRQGLERTGLAREDIFVTSKVWNADQGYESTIAAYETSLSKLGLEYLDLYLIHWPVADKFKESWRALETLYKEGRVKAIGVSNFLVPQLEELIKDAEIKPMVDQMEHHPRLTQKGLQAFCKANDIQFEAWSPLMQGKLLDNVELAAIGEKYGKSIAQVILRWNLQNGVVTIPKSTKEHRIVENASLFDFELTIEDMERIDGLDQNIRVGPDPDNFDF